MQGAQSGGHATVKQIANPPARPRKLPKCTRFEQLTIEVAGVSIIRPWPSHRWRGSPTLPFRRMVAGFGAGLVVSEMVASQEMVQAKPGVRERAELGLAEQATSVQLAGRDAWWMAEAARMVEANGARIIGHQHGLPGQEGHRRSLGFGADEDAGTTP